MLYLRKYFVWILSHPCIWQFWAEHLLVSGWMTQVLLLEMRDQYQYDTLSFPHSNELQTQRRVLHYILVGLLVLLIFWYKGKKPIHVSFIFESNWLYTSCFPHSHACHCNRTSSFQSIWILSDLDTYLKIYWYLKITKSECTTAFDFFI